MAEDFPPARLAAAEVVYRRDSERRTMEAELHVMKSYAERPERITQTKIARMSKPEMNGTHTQSAILSTNSEGRKYLNNDAAIMCAEALEKSKHHFYVIPLVAIS